VTQARIPTTHVGSLPRPREVVDVVFAQDRGDTVDPIEFDRVIGDAVRDPVEHQVQAGIDLVSDGEMSKIGYATYIRHRLSGFEVGDVPRATPADLDAYPSFRDRLAQEGGSARYLRPICRGPITYEHREPLERDLGRLQAGIEGQPVAGAFMNAPSPGIIALFAPNESTKAPTTSTSTWRRSSRRSCEPSRRRFCSRQPTRAMPTNGRCGARRRFRRTRSSPRE
jgi:5-methyltetrahydropteroyltriglutamate--homocysteine methyltransferase